MLETLVAFSGCSEDKRRCEVVIGCLGKLNAGSLFAARRRRTEGERDMVMAGELLIFGKAA